jgi:N-acetylmuramoyl-L-alanine amidase
MAKSIVLQSGHQNIQFNSDEALHGSTGAPQEAGKNYKITSRTAELLRARGFSVKQTDANANSDPAITDRDWDLFLSIHCDSDSSTNGGFTDFPEPSTDGATVESQRIANAIALKFFSETGITERLDRRQKSAGVMYYYMWHDLSAATPCVLIEMGESVDAHDSVILNDTERCAKALARGVCQAFGVAYDPVQPPTPVEPMVSIKKSEYDALKTQVSSLNTKATELGAKLAVKDNECQVKLNAQKKKVSDFVSSI